MAARRLGRIEVVTLGPDVEAKKTGENQRKRKLEFYYLASKFHYTFFFTNESRFQTNVGRYSAHFSHLVPVTFFAL